MLRNSQFKSSLPPSLLRGCECCRKSMRANESRVPTTEKTTAIFGRLIGYVLPKGFLCSKCNVHLLTFEVFYNDVFKKHFFLNKKPTQWTIPANLLDQPFQVKTRVSHIHETLATKKAMTPVAFLQESKKFEWKPSSGGIRVLGRLEDVKNVVGSAKISHTPVRIIKHTPPVHKIAKKNYDTVLRTPLRNVITIAQEERTDDDEEENFVRVEEVDEDEEFEENSLRVEEISSEIDENQPKTVKISREIAEVPPEPVTKKLKIQEASAVIANEAPDFDAANLSVIVKQEPQEKFPVIEEDAPIFNLATVKTEIIDDFPNEHHIPEFPLTTSTFDLPENVIVKEEYDFGEFETPVEEYKPPNIENEEHRQAIIESFSGLKNLVIKEAVKEKIAEKKMKMQKRKTLAIGIPENVTVVDNFMVTEEETDESQTSKPCKVMNQSRRSMRQVEDSRYTKFKCEHCSVVSRSRFLVIRHIKEMHALHCTLCLVIFPTANKLAMHQESMHKISPCEDSGRRKQKLQAKKEEVPAAFRMRSIATEKL